MSLFRKGIYKPRVLFTTGAVIKIIADVWAILVDRAFFSRFAMSGNAYLRQYALGFWLLVLAGTVLTIWCFRSHSVRAAILVSAVASANAIFLFVLYAKSVRGNDVFGTDAYMLVSVYLCVLWAILALIVGFLGKGPKSIAWKG
jgi:hypothetical protein